MAKRRSVIFFQKQRDWALNPPDLQFDVLYIMLSAGCAQFKITMLQIDTNTDYNN